MKIKQICASTAFGVALLVAGAAGAATITSNSSCQLGEVTGASGSAINCFGVTISATGYTGGDPSKNDNNASINGDTFAADYFGVTTTGLFGFQDWTDLGKTESGSTIGSIGLWADDGTGGSAWGSSSGDWGALAGSFSAFSHVAVLLKTSTSWAAYLFNGATLGSGGTWNTSAFGSNDLSHLRVIARNPSPVPLPAAAWMLLSGVLGLGAVSRLRRRSA